MAHITVTNTYEDGSGAGLSGNVTFTPVVTADDGGSVTFIADPVAYRVSAGELSATVLTTDSYTAVEGAVTYRVVERIGSTFRRKFYVALPSSLGSTVELGDLTTYQDPPNTIVLGGGTVVDLSSHLATAHGPITAELADHEARIVDLEGGSAPVIGAHNTLTGRSAADAHPQSAITDLVSDLANKQPLNANLTQFAALTIPDNSIVQKISGSLAARTMAQLKTALGLVKADVGLGNVDNVSDANKWIAPKALTHTAIDFDYDTTLNIAENIPYDAIPGLEGDLAAAAGSGGSFQVHWNGSSWPARSTSGTSDPNVEVEWVGGTTPPAISGSGATGAIGYTDITQPKDIWKTHV